MSTSINQFVALQSATETSIERGGKSVVDQSLVASDELQDKIEERAFPGNKLSTFTGLSRFLPFENDNASSIVPIYTVKRCRPQIHKVASYHSFQVEFGSFTPTTSTMSISSASSGPSVATPQTETVSLGSSTAASSQILIKDAQTPSSSSENSSSSLSDLAERTQFATINATPDQVLGLVAPITSSHLTDGESSQGPPQRTRGRGLERLFFIPPREEEGDGDHESFILSDVSDDSEEEGGIGFPSYQRAGLGMKRSFGRINDVYASLAILRNNEATITPIESVATHFLAPTSPSMASDTTPRAPRSPAMDTVSESGATVTIDNFIEHESAQRAETSDVRSVLTESIYSPTAFRAPGFDRLPIRVASDDNTHSNDIIFINPTNMVHPPVHHLVSFNQGESIQTQTSGFRIDRSRTSRNRNVNPASSGVTSQAIMPAPKKKKTLMSKLKKLLCMSNKHIE